MPEPLGRIAPTQLVGACAKFYPKCCQYHQGWDDALKAMLDLFPDDNPVQFRSWNYAIEQLVDDGQSQGPRWERVL